MNNDYLVSVRLMTYMHEAFINEAMDSIMMQETTFNVEVVVGDDFSTDRTLEIIKEYQNKENIHIRILDRKKGDDYWQQRQKLGRLYNFTNILDNCHGKYVAILDGDDYWTDPLKLQKQVDFLEAHPEFSICGSLATRSYDNPAIPNDIEGDAGVFEQKDLAQRNFIPTATALFKRTCVVDCPQWVLNCPIGDWPLFLICLNYGKIKIFEEQMALRRVHAGGMWGANINGQNNDKNILRLITMFDVIRDKFNPDINAILHDNYLKQLIKLVELNLKQHRFEEVAQYLQVLVKEGCSRSQETENLTTAIAKKLTVQAQEINDLKTLNTKLRNSNAYKLGRQVTGLFKFLKKR